MLQTARNQLLACYRPVKRLLRLFGIVLSLLGAAYAQAMDATVDPLPAAQDVYTLPELARAADGLVRLEDGRTEHLRHLFAGHIVLLSFIYTRCTDGQGCPLATAILRQVLQRAEKPIPLRVVSLSFDPDHDTPALMRAYAQQFRRSGEQRWSFVLPHDRTVLQTLLQAYGQTLQADPPSAGSAAFTHLLRVFLIDQRGQIRTVYGAGMMDADLILNDIRTLSTPSRGVQQARVERPAPIDLLALSRKRVLGFPPLRIPQDDPLTKTKIALGRKLFFDRRLSVNGTLSCGNCHVPNQGYANNEMATAVGVEGRTVRRNAPSLIDIGYAERLFHDGREYALETQVWSPLLAHNEMAAPSVGWVIAMLQKLPDYRGLFEAAYGKPVGMETLGKALASYERALLGGSSAFDRWHFGHDRNAVSSTIQRGFGLFTGKAGCASCHTLHADYALFTDNQFHLSGLAWKKSMGAADDAQNVPLAPGVQTKLPAATLQTLAETPENDLGRYEITFDPDDRWAFKTPSLRNVALTAPYMHDGALADLTGVVAYYNAGGVPDAPQDPRIKPLQLSTEEQADLVAFLGSLTGSNVARLAADGSNAPIGDPEAVSGD